MMYSPTAAFGPMHVKQLVGGALALVCLLSACTVQDDRPQTLAYITQTILAPSCGTATCHSALKRQSELVLDSVAAAQESIARLRLVATCFRPPCDSDVIENSQLLTVITTGDSQLQRMPLDAPLPNKDIQLIADWIHNGAAGYVPPAAP
jgi:hypothetical protein